MAAKIRYFSLDIWGCQRVNDNCICWQARSVLMWGSAGFQTHSTRMWAPGSHSGQPQCSPSQCPPQKRQTRSNQIRVREQPTQKTHSTTAAASSLHTASKHTSNTCTHTSGMVSGFSLYHQLHRGTVLFSFSFLPVSLPAALPLPICMLCCYVCGSECD